MSHKDPKITALIEGCEGWGVDPHYIGYFRSFNRGLFFEAHEVLEHIWLPARRGPLDAFYKGLIQLAGAFVHLQKQRLRPSRALFLLAQANLDQYPDQFENLDVASVQSTIRDWLGHLEESGLKQNPLNHYAPPKLGLIGMAAIR